MPRPIRPLFFLCLKGIKTRRIHIGHAVFVNKIGKVGRKPFARICQTRRGRQPGAPADQNALRALEQRLRPREARLQTLFHTAGCPPDAAVAA